MNKKFETAVKDRISFGFGKNIKETFNVDVNVKLELFDEFGKLKDVREFHNEVKNAGLYGLMDQLLASPSLTKPTHMELGTGTGGTTKLATYIADSRVALGTKTRDTATVTLPATFGAGVGTGAITEAGIFDSATQDAGNMWLYASFAAVNKAAGDSLSVTWTFSAAAS